MKYYPEYRTAFDDLIDDVFGMPQFSVPAGSLMKTDIREKDGKYYLDIDLPGFNKEDIQMSLFNGKLTVSAQHNENKEEKDEKGKILRQERFTGSCSRTWYVGESIQEGDINANFHDGILTIEVPSETKKAEQETKYISID